MATPTASALAGLTIETLNSIIADIEQQNREYRSSLGLPEPLPPPAEEQQQGVKKVYKRDLADHIEQLLRDKDGLVHQLGVHRSRQMITELQTQQGEASLLIFQQRERISQLEQANLHWQEQVEQAGLVVSQQRERMALMEQAGTMLQDQCKNANLALAQQQERIVQLQAHCDHANLIISQYQKRIEQAQEDLKQRTAAHQDEVLRLKRQVQQLRSEKEEPLEQHPTIALAKAILRGKRPINHHQVKEWRVALHPDRTGRDAQITPAQRAVCEEAYKLVV